ncbi:MAG TPA: CAP domain-containing protein [Cerasibacillus sp.]|uniref:CAP domain-containing protein n=1 Tax=Cerasibacillus sp. TaxID=2498711 RepID=UPI002F3ED9E5
MLKKVTAVTALSAAILFGGNLGTVDASISSPEPVKQQTYTKVYYSVNGKWQPLNDQYKTIIKRCFPNIQWEKGTSENKTSDNKSKDTQVQKPKESVKQPTNHVDQKPKEPVKQPTNVENNTQPTQNTKPSAPEQKQDETNKGYALNQYEQEVVELTNQERTKRGLKPFKINNELSQVAREKSRDMAVNGYFSHNSPTYGSPFDMMKKWGITYRTAGENIAKGQRTPQQVVQAWMNSDGHRKNILNPNFTEIGVGYIEKGNVWTQQFIGR